MNSIEKSLEEALESLREFVLTGKENENLKGIGLLYFKVRIFYDDEKINLERVMFSKEADDFLKKLI